MTGHGSYGKIRGAYVRVLLCKVKADTFLTDLSGNVTRHEKHRKVTYYWSLK